MRQTASAGEALALHHSFRLHVPTGVLVAVIELLRIRCHPGRREEFLARDAEIWTPALARHEGFIAKEVWSSLEDPDLVTIVVRWASMGKWEAFPMLLCCELDERMADVQASVACEAYETHD